MIGFEDKSIQAITAGNIGTGIGAVTGHFLLAGLIEVRGGGEWFTLSMVFLPIYFVIAAGATYALSGMVSPGITASEVKSARLWLINTGLIAAVVGLALKPSVFVAIATAVAGALWAVTLRFRQPAA